MSNFAAKLAYMSLDLILEICGTIVGLLYLYYEYKANSLVWIMGAIMPALSLGVYYNAGLYADFGINIYYLLAAIYGFVVWVSHRLRYKEDLPITKMPKKYYWQIMLIVLLLYLVIYYMLIKFTDSNVPSCDSFTTAMSVVAMFMLARKYVEQWIAWIMVDAVSVGLYVYKGIYFYAALYTIYTVVAIFGFYNWKRLMRND